MKTFQHPAFGPFTVPRVWNRHNEHPAGAVYCGRGTPYGNPFEIGTHGTRDFCIKRFVREVLPTLDVSDLRSKHLLCSCAPKPCHCDPILLKANEDQVFVAATGHRPNKCGGYTSKARSAMIEVAVEHLALLPRLDGVISGVALGWDQAVAYAAMHLKVPVIAAVPFEGQQKKWPLEAQAQYRKLLDRCDEVVLVSPGGYSPDKMQRRNEWMVDHGDRIAALFNGSSGGTANCLAYAKTRRRPIDNLWRDFSNLSGHGGDDLRRRQP